MKYPTVKDSLIERIDSLPSEYLANINENLPIKESGQKAKHGYVGHTAYSPDYNAIVYEIVRNSDEILYTIDGTGVAISNHILDTVRNKYDIEYVFVFREESNELIVIPEKEFDISYEPSGYDKQKAASLDDAIHNIKDGDTIKSDKPFAAENAITIDEAMQLTK